MGRIHCIGDKVIIACGDQVFHFIYAIKDDVVTLRRSKTFSLSTDVSCANEKGHSFDPATKKQNHQVLASTVGHHGSLIAVVTSTKLCFVLDLLNNCRLYRPVINLQKAPTAVIFDHDDNYLIISDRAGFVYRFPVGTKQKAEDEASFEGEVLVGHVSMVLDIALTQDGRYLISADRDEKVRVSCYPETHVIHQYLLGHTSYVNSIATHDSFIYSAGGDGRLIKWNIHSDGVSLMSTVHKGPIRYIRCFSCREKKATQVLVVFDYSEGFELLSLDDKIERMFVQCGSALMDAVFAKDGMHIFGLTSQYTHVFTDVLLEYRGTRFLHWQGMIDMQYEKTIPHAEARRKSNLEMTCKVSMNKLSQYLFFCVKQDSFL